MANVLPHGLVNLARLVPVVSAEMVELALATGTVKPPFSSQRILWGPKQLPGQYNFFLGGVLTANSTMDPKTLF